MEWKIGTWCHWRSPVKLPFVILGPLCDELSESRYMCSRLRGHGGRHAAVATGGDVCEVWE